ncbi:MAG: ATP-binding protein, partial [Actinomycetes bacterium]
MARVLDASASTPFIGRVRELREIGQALGRARAGNGSVVLVTGEPGIGKTRLVEEAVGDHTGPLAWGLCAADDGAPAFRPWIDVLSRFTDRLVVPAPGRAAENLDAFTGGHPHRSTSADASRFRLFEDVVDVLAAASRDDVAVIVLDDLHRADVDSVHLLRFVAVQA